MGGWEGPPHLISEKEVFFHEVHTHDIEDGGAWSGWIGGSVGGSNGLDGGECGGLDALLNFMGWVGGWVFNQ